MATDLLLDCGQAEQFKAGVHLGIFGLAVACLGYNAMAWGQRREQHLLNNMGVYAILAAYEVHQMALHWNAGHGRIEESKELL